MAHYYLHHRREDETFADDEGADYVDLADARADAIQSARELMAQQVLEGQPPGDGEFLIADATGEVIERVAFKDALSGPLGRKPSPRRYWLGS